MSEAKFNEEPYRVAVVGGAGTWGRKYLASYAKHPSARIVALVDRAANRRAKFADHYAIEAQFDTVDELLCHEVPDIVSIILPVSQTHDAVIACAEAGVKAISCEKPIAAELRMADEIVRVCRDRGVPLGCGNAYWDTPHLLATVQWIRDGNIGNLTAASIPTGLPLEASGAGCVQLTITRLLTGMEVEWVEGWTLPPDPTWSVPDGGSDEQLDRPAYGRLGLSGGIVCEIAKPEPGRAVSSPAHVAGDNGQVWLARPRSVLIQGVNHLASPVYPKFLAEPWHADFFTPTIERLFEAVESGGEAPCSGHDYRQALEIAIALIQSSLNGNERIHLPLADRTASIYPQPYRWQGGDVAGWESAGYVGPPEIEKP